MDIVKLLKYAAIAEEGAELIEHAKDDLAGAKAGKSFEEKVNVTISGVPFEVYVGLRPVSANATTDF